MQRIKGFDGLRAVAVTIVFLQHFTSLGYTWEMGSYGVWLFFALSGFLIARILHADRLAVEAGRLSRLEALSAFAWRRALRILPIYYLALGVFTVLAWLEVVRDFPLTDAWWHYGYLSNVYFGQVLGAWTGRFGSLWSLAVEQQFYILAAPALLLAPARWARPLCAAVALAALAHSSLLWAGGAKPIEVYTSSLLNFGILAFGGWIGLSLPARPRDGARSWPALACFAVIAAVGATFALMDDVPRQAMVLIGGVPAAATAIFGALALASLHQNQQSRLARALEWAPLAGFGKISYAFYLFHNLPPHRLLTWAAIKLDVPLRASETVEAVVSFLIALALAALSWRLIERPMMRLKDRPEALAGLFTRRRMAVAVRP